MIQCYECRGSFCESDVEDYEGRLVCNRCRDYYAVHDALNGVILRVVQIERKDPQTAMGILDEVLGSNRHLDHTGWLDRSVRAHKANILAQQDQHEEAVAILRAITPLMEPERDSIRGSSDFIINQCALAHSLRTLGRHKEALEALHQALIGRVIPMTLDALDMYANVANEIGLEVPSSYKNTIVDVAKIWGIDLIEEANESGQALICSLVQQRAHGRSRHRRLTQQLSLAKSKVERVEAIESYLGSETVGWYREDAHRRLVREQGS